MKKPYNIAIIILIIVVTIIFGINIYLIAVGNKNNINNENIINEKTNDVLTYDDTEYIGYLKIDSINLYAPIKDGTDLSILKDAIGHFTESSYFSGNIALAAHNRGNNQNFFENLKDIKKGAEVTYITKYSEQKYYVSEIKEIEETDLSVLNPTESNQITMITCIANQRSKRLCVIATER